MNSLFQFNNINNSVDEFISSVRQGIPSAVFGVSKSFKNYLVSNVEGQVLYIVKDSLLAGIALREISEYSGKKVIYIPAKDEILLPTRGFSKDSEYQRIKALSEIKTADVVIVTAESCLQTYPIKTEKTVIKKDNDYNEEEIVSKIVGLGYKRVESVEAKGTFSKRGDLIDIFPINEENPYRIDFFGDTVESIKQFDIESRKTVCMSNAVEILQASEFLLDDKNINKVAGIIDGEVKSCPRESVARLMELQGDFTLACENRDYTLLGVLSSALGVSSDVFGLMKDDATVVIDEAKQVCDVMNLYQTEFTERYKSLLSGGEIFSCEKENMLSVERLIERVKTFKLSAVQTLSTAIPFFNPLKLITPETSGVANYQLDFNEVYTDINNWLKTGYRIIVYTGDGHRAERFNLDLSERGIASSVDCEGEIKGVAIFSKRISSGFVFHEDKTVIIGADNLYVKPDSVTKIKSKRQAFFSAPEIGDYCVHETFGIGRVLGNKKISTTEGTKDYISVEYAGGDMLYIPVEQMDVLTRYLGGEKHPRLSKIGGTDFERIKKNVRESIKKMSFDLKKLYSERQATTGYPFVADTELEKEFDKAFPFTETPDQQQADKDIKTDMTSGTVMDRLVCGDVGYGKTEVAFRAIFRAIANDKQTALLAPTTILTEQHFNTALSRFKGFGIKIQCLNRFRTKKQQEQIIKDLKNGEIDLIIGTHRLLSKDIEFKDLGLLVLDEEQRFGVEHKEKIKLLKKNVDTLTLTATPIPRTLHMSLTGIRSISTINTPPKKRLPVQTYVTEETDTLIKDAISREINRNGQSFILYNRVESIDGFAKHMQDIMPDVRFSVTHGQMEERVLEKRIMDFYKGESDVLISTTIIENGIDLPRANTLIVIDADRLGLSSLYQLKGRVGRSDRLAYAYFTFKRDKILSSTASERLNAIIEFAEMGSGIKIAMRDLEIRGAGNILGAEQHGHMDKIGYELYSKLLKEEITGEEELIPELDIRISSLIPEDYIMGNSARMDAYKEIAEIDSDESEKECREFLINSYGKIPKQTENLINIAVVKRLAMKLKASEITLSKDEVSISFNEFKDLSDGRVINAVEKMGKDAKLTMAKRPKIEFIKTETSDKMLLKMRSLLESALK